MIRVNFLLIPALLFSTYASGQVSDFKSISFSKSDSIAKSYFGHDLNNPEEFAQELTNDLTTEAEKFRTIFRWVCDNISFDVEMFHRHVKKRNQYRYKKEKLETWRKKVNRKAYQRVLDKKLALFSGYAALLETMSRSIGLPCVIIEGVSKDEMGSKIASTWNAVQLNNKWFLADAGQSSGYVDSTVTEFTHEFNDTYFLTDPNYFIANHYPDNGAWSFVYQKPTLKEFLEAPVREDGFILNEINHFHPLKGTLKTKLDSSIVFRFTSNSFEPPDRVVVRINNSKHYFKFKHKLERNAFGELCFNQIFTRKGRFELLIYIKGNLAFIYEVFVT